MNEITINWHIIQKCNYKCYYCFAKYANSVNREVHESKRDSEQLLKNVYKYFTEEYPNYSIRLNIAGGEPTLSKNLDFIIQKAQSIGFVVSLISNASKLTTKFIEQNAKYLSMFAMSVDSLDEIQQKSIGRISRDTTLSTSKMIKNIELFRVYGKDIKIKINTVVNAHNYTTDLANFIDLVKPDKWKILQAVSLSSEIYCSDDEFKIFLDNHIHISSKIYKEKNQDMKDSYIMIDPHGRFYQNSNDEYSYSKSILHVDMNEAFKSLKFDFKKYSNRYNQEK